MRFETTPQVEPINFGMLSKEANWHEARGWKARDFGRCPDHGLYVGPQCPDCKWHEPKAA